MNVELLKKVKMIMETETFKKIVQTAITAVSSQIIKNVSQKFSATATKREENMSDGMNRDQAFNHEREEYEEVFEDYQDEFNNENINWKDLSKNIFRNAFSFVEDKLNLDNSELFSNFKEYISYLEEDITEEDEKLLINKLFALIDGLQGDKKLEKLIGEDNYKELLTILIKHSMNVTRVVYNYGRNRINEFQMKEKLQSLYEDYILVVFDFVKNNPVVKEHGLAVLNFAFGNKAAAVQSVIMTVAVNVFDEEKRVEMANTFNKVKSKVKSWFGNMKTKVMRKEKESQYENYES